MFNMGTGHCDDRTLRVLSMSLYAGQLWNLYFSYRLPSFPPKLSIRPQPCCQAFPPEKCLPSLWRKVREKEQVTRKKPSLGSVLNLTLHSYYSPRNPQDALLLCTHYRGRWGRGELSFVFACIIEKLRPEETQQFMREKLYLLPVLQYTKNKNPNFLDFHSGDLFIAAKVNSDKY